MTDNAKKLAARDLIEAIVLLYGVPEEPSMRNKSVDIIARALTAHGTAQYNQAIEDAAQVSETSWPGSTPKEIRALKKKVADETRSGNELWAEDLNDE